MINNNLPEYTLVELSQRNGLTNPESWIAYKGLIYNMTSSMLWNYGIHFEHWAGQDLTLEMANAPHAEGVFKKFKPIGKLVV